MEQQQEQRSPEEIRDDIDRTREGLGDTAAALAEKTDLKGQALQFVRDHSTAVGIGGAFVAGFAVGKLRSR